MNDPSVYFLWIASAILILSIVELVIPAERGQSLKGRLRNVMYLVLFHFFGIVGFYLVYVFFYPTAIWSYAPSNVELLLFVPLNLFAIDFIFYWYHRAQHTFSWLWPLHELHHSESELNVTTSYRTYWLEMPLQNLFIIFPTILIFGELGPVHALIMPFAVSAFLLITHSNTRISFGWFNRVLCSPQIHRIHHSIDDKHLGKNFAQFFPFIDILFGTYHHPKDSEYPKTGLVDIPSDMPIHRSLLRPFNEWAKIIFTRGDRNA